MAKIPDINKLSSEVTQKYQLANEAFIREVKSNPKDRIEVEVGDSKQPDFKPQFKFMRWDNEVNFSIRAEEQPGATVETQGEKIIYKTPDYEVHQYDKPDASEDGGFEFEWVLPKKPLTNVLTATIQSKELNFFYQPPLTQQEIDQGTSRPENVVGSYAVYHKTKGGINRADGMEYKVGKAFHIYRPKVTDANGVETWGELNVDEQAGLLTVTIDQAWLDSAVYPVVVDPTLGYTSIGASYNNIASNTSDTSEQNGMSFTVTGSGVLSKISAVVFTSTGTEAVDTFAALYREDSAGAGSHDLVVGIENANLSVDTTKPFYDFTAASETLTADTYIFSIVANGEDVAGAGTAIRIAVDVLSGVGKNFYNESTTGAGSYATRKAENPWTETASAQFNIFSIYATYVADAGQTVTEEFGSSVTWTAPTGVTSIVVKAWGGGAKGGARSTNGVSGGGGGGAYATSTVSITPGNPYDIVIGVAGIIGAINGGNTTFNSTTVVAAGGSGVSDNTATGGAGGSLAASTGDTEAAGGAGGNGSAGSGSGGGGEAGGAGGTGDAGNTGAAGGAGGSGVNDPGGDGGNGKITTQGNGTNGTPPGGGGGGGYMTSTGPRQGGDGSKGFMIITYTAPASAVVKLQHLTLLGVG